MIPDAIPPQVAAVTIAVLGGARTVREVSRAVGRSVQPTHRALRKARDAGLVRWEDGKAGTLRSTLGEAAQVVLSQGTGGLVSLDEALKQASVLVSAALRDLGGADAASAP